MGFPCYPAQASQNSALPGGLEHSSFSAVEVEKGGRWPAGRSGDGGRQVQRTQSGGCPAPEAGTSAAIEPPGPPIGVGRLAGVADWGAAGTSLNRGRTQRNVSEFPAGFLLGE